MMLVPVVVLWALAPFLIQAATGDAAQPQMPPASSSSPLSQRPPHPSYFQHLESNGRLDQPPVTLTASPGEDACLPCGTQPWGHLRGVTLTCTHQAGDHHPVLILSHLLGWQPPQEPGWHPTQEPESRFRGRVAFCTAGPGDTGVSLLLRNLSHPDFGNYSCYVATNASDVPQLLCSLVLQPDGAEVPKDAEPDMIMVVCVLTAAFTTVAIGVVICCRCGRRCCGHRAQEAGAVDGGGGRAAVALSDLKTLNA